MELFKMSVAIAMVLLLSLIAERVSPSLAGILCGYPLGVAITLFFVGYEISPEFASKSALFTAVGLIGTQASAYGYYRFSLLARGRGRVQQVAISAIGGLAVFFSSHNTPKNRHNSASPPLNAMAPLRTHHPHDFSSS